MKHSYTPLYLIKYIYGEQNVLRRLEVEHRIETEAPIRRAYITLRKTYSLLPKFSFNPSDKTIANILEYSGKARLNTSY